jgi:hypothetical protein
MTAPTSTTTRAGSRTNKGMVTKKKGMVTSLNVITKVFIATTCIAAKGIAWPVTFVVRQYIQHIRDLKGLAA